MNRTPKAAELALLASLVVLAGAELLIRGPMRQGKGQDLAAPYVSALRFIHGQNPYPADDFLNSWHRAGAPTSLTLDDSGQRPIYPPTTLLVVAPLAELRWPSAVLLYMWACTLSYATLIWLLARLVDDRWRSAKRLGFVAFALGVASVHTGIALGNLSAAVFVLCGYALYISYFSDTAISGILLSIAFCVKPPAAIAAVLLHLFLRRTRAVLAFLGTSVVIACTAAALMLRVDPHWKAAYQDNLQSVLSRNGAADFTANNLARFDAVNLQVPLYTLFHNVQVANSLALAISGTLAILWLILFGRNRSITTGSYWLVAGTLSLVALLPVYQRSYNCGVIVFVALWAFNEIHEVQAKATLLASLAFLLPGKAILQDSGLAAEHSSSILWNLLLMSQLTWSIIAVIAICLSYKARAPAGLARVN